MPNISVGLGIDTRRRWLQPETHAWMAAVYADGGTASSDDLMALDAWVRGCKIDGIFSEIRRANLYCGRQLTAALRPVVATFGSARDTNNGFVAADFTPSTGLTGDGASKYLDTGYTPTEATGGLALYLRGTAGTSIPMGCRDAGSSQLYWLRQTGTPTTDGAWGGSLVCNPAGTLTAGLWGVSRSANNDLRLYKNGVQQGSTNTGVAAPATPGNSIAVHAFRFGAASVGGFTAAPVGGYIIVGALTPTQWERLFARTHAYMQALGRGV